MQTHALCAMPSARLRCALLVVMLLARVVSAQVSGSIAGYVHDPSGAAVPNTTVNIPISCESANTARLYSSITRILALAG